jgi:protein ImuB
MLWIALYLPQLPLDLAYRRWPEALHDSLRQSVPLAVTQARRIGWANPCAQEAGVVPGMPESAALARLANIVLLPRDPALEAAATIEAALWTLHFTPLVSLLEGGLLMEVSGSLRLFGGLEALLQQIRGGVLELGFTPQMASAPTAAAAWILARQADGLHGDHAGFSALLDRLPVSLLASVQAHLDTLLAIGCQKIGQLRQLPRHGITRRFGKPVLQELDRAFGAEPEVHEWYAPAENFSARMELAARVDTAEAVMHAARRMLLQMTGWLVARHSAVLQFSLLLHHETVRVREKRTTTLPILLASASRDLGHLHLLLQEHLSKVDWSSSVIELGLQADRVELLAAPNTELFPAPLSQAESVGRLVERLASRLGEDAIYRLSVTGDHRPERCSVAAASAVSARRVRASVPAFAARPAWLLEEPLPLMVRQHKPFYQSALTLLAGPERIEAGWWDDGLATRDYFIARNEGHLLLWVYRERQGVHVQEGGWFLHGYFG